MSEILAPAGDEKSALAAINAGADAIYLGLKQFSARSSAKNFDFEVFEQIVKYAHAFGVKVYVAMNTLVKNSELLNFLSSAVAAWNCGADALIISDVFLGAFIKKNYPNIVLHLSTQAGVCNAYGASFAKKLGFSRVILARETTIEDIKEIAKIIETEVFIQGALCTCFSGQCYLSSFAGGNSGNRGKCKQPCRKKYSIDRDGFEECAYRLSLSDLSVGEDVKHLIAAGVFSFKIEGRMRRAEYVSSAVKYYRNILNGCVNASDLSDLKRTYNRGNYTKGLAFGQDKSFISSAVQGHIGEFVGQIKVVNGKYFCQSSSKFGAGDGFKVLRDGKEVGGAVFSQPAKNGFFVTSNGRLKNGDKIFITTDTLLNERLTAFNSKISVKVSAEFKQGEKSVIYLNGEKYCIGNVLSPSQSRPLTRTDVENCFKKVDKYPFEVSFGKIKCEEVFIPASELNAVRREAFARYFGSITKNDNEKYEIKFTLPALDKAKCPKIAVIGSDLGEICADIGIFKLNDLYGDLDILKDFKGERFLYLPPFLTGKEIEKAKSVAVSFDGIYCDGIYGFALSEELKKPLFAGTGLNVSNVIALKECNSKYVALSKELTLIEADELCADNVFYLGVGDLKVMDLIYCPFEKKCKMCDMREIYTLTDENGRKFPIKRYRTEECRFEIYNCAAIVSKAPDCGLLVDCSLQEQPKKVIELCKNTEKLREYFRNVTGGHSIRPVN